ncbi:MAG: thioredoxin [Patescibacteria group bacterium]|jgi:thioredoxin 1
MLHITTDAEFKKEVLDEQTKPVLVDFFAKWCVPCKVLGPVVEKLEADNPNVKVVEVDVDLAQDLSMKYGVMSIPTIYVFKKGKMTQQFIGAQDQKTLEAALA